eukprot:Hpha_TRINITY_DN35656_c0_g1::TRINITY_DN35656_c0_g1_i1::g.68675::m.68675/K03926/cutA; periplasmic divalent cation tolerance protein
MLRLTHPIARVIRGRRMASDYSVCYVTCPLPKEGKDTAVELAKGLVQSKLAACVNISPQVRSVYMWEGKAEDDGEQLLMIKTRASLVEELTKFVNEHHPYDCPEVISVPITGGSEKYLQFVRDGTKDAP